MCVRRCHQCGSVASCVRRDPRRATHLAKRRVARYTGCRFRLAARQPLAAAGGSESTVEALTTRGSREGATHGACGRRGRRG